MIGRNRRCLLMLMSGADVTLRRAGFGTTDFEIARLSRVSGDPGIIACMTQSEQVLRMADLRRACSVLVDEAERRFGDEVVLSEVPVDYYWSVDLAAAFDMSQAPAAQLGCGQVSDDVTEISALVRRAPEDVIALWHDLDHLVGVMRLLAHLDLPR